MSYLFLYIAMLSVQYVEAYRYSVDFNARVACHHYSFEHNENHKNGG